MAARRSEPLPAPGRLFPCQCGFAQVDTKGVSCKLDAKVAFFTESCSGTRNDTPSRLGVQFPMTAYSHVPVSTGLAAAAGVAPKETLPARSGNGEVGWGADVAYKLVAC